MSRWAAGRERDKGYVAAAATVAAVTARRGGLGVCWTCELRGTVIKASLRRKCRTIYRRARPSITTTLMNGDTHALLIATAMYMYSTSYYVYSVPFTANS